MDEEIKFEEDKKEKKPLNMKLIMYILIGISVLLLIFLIISMSNNAKLKKRGSVDISGNEQHVEVMDVTNEEVQDLFTTTTGTISNYCRKEKSLFTDSKVDIGSLSDDIVYGIAMNKIVVKDKITGNISRRLVKDEISRLFGEKYKYEDSQVTTYPAYTYIEDSATYSPNSAGKPFTPTVCDLYRVVKSYKQGEDFYIYARVLFVSNDKKEIKYYSDYRHSDELANLDKNSSGALLANEKNFSKGTLYEMKYTLDANNNYVFNYSQPTS